MAYQFDAKKNIEAANRLMGVLDYCCKMVNSEETLPVTIIVDDRLKSALSVAIDELKQPNPCNNCVGVGLAVSHGYADMRLRTEEDS